MSKKMNVGNRIYDVISLQDYESNPTAYENSTGMTAIEDNGYVYPIVRNTNDYGFIRKECISIFNEPEGMDKEKYAVHSAIDFDNVESMKQLIAKNSEYRDMERQILVNPDNIFTPRITEKDSPEMRGLKQAVIDKNIDIDKYESRFGSNYQNDKRLFNNSTITLAKLKTISEALDMKTTLIIEDKNKDVPNPMNTRIVVELTGGNLDE